MLVDCSSVYDYSLFCCDEFFQSSRSLVCDKRTHYTAEYHQAYRNSYTSYHRYTPLLYASILHHKTQNTEIINTFQSNIVSYDQVSSDYFLDFLNMRSYIKIQVCLSFSSHTASWCNVNVGMLYNSTALDVQTNQIDHLRPLIGGPASTLDFTVAGFLRGRFYLFFTQRGVSSSAHDLSDFYVTNINTLQGGKEIGRAHV